MPQPEPAGARPLLLILPGATADADRFSACQELAAEHWPEARVEMPNYLARWRGIGGVGRWLDGWAERSISPAEPVYVLAFILGGAALPYAPGLLRRTQKLALVRSRYQEGVPLALRRRFGRFLTTVLFGRYVSDLGRPPFWPAAFRPSCPQLVLLETRPTALAERLKVAPLTDADLGVGDALELPINHDIAYHSGRLMKAATDWFKA
jgi:hypothetical protein